MRIPLDRSKDRKGRLPLARQIQLHLERLITQRLLAPGLKLPATRDLARDLGVNRTTVAQAYEDQIAGTPSGVISFAGGMPDSALFPTDAFRRVLNRVIREEGRELLQYYPSSGYPSLRQDLCGLPLR